MNFADRLARLITQKGRWVALGAVALLAASLWPLAHISFNTDIFGLMPQDSPALRTFREFNDNFSRGSDLIVTIETTANQTDAEVNQFIESYTDALKTIPEIRAVHFQTDDDGYAAAWLPILPHLSLWMTADDWNETNKRLQPEAVTTRVKRLRAEMQAAPSPALAMRMTADPLKILELGARRFEAQTRGDEPETSIASPFRSADGKLRLIYVEARSDKPDGVRDSHFCMRLMEKVREVPTSSFRIRYTGLVAFTSEIAGKMRRTMVLQAVSSMMTVIFIFWLAFRRIYPLVCIALTLALAILTTIAIGQVIFGGLNLITVSFAAILVGLGVDYGIVLYERMEKSPTEMASATLNAVGGGIVLGATTTAAAFLAMALSGSPAFRQFGFIVAIGIGFCAALMLTLYLWLQELRPPKPVASRAESGKPRSPPAAPIIVAAVLLLAALAVLFVGRTPAVRFDSDPASLQFRRLEAQETLRIVRSKMGARDQSLVVLTRGNGWREAADRARELETKLEASKANGNVTALESATRFLPPTNGGNGIRAAMTQIGFRQGSEAFRTALTMNRLNPEAFQSTFDWLERMERAKSDPSALDSSLTEALGATASLGPFVGRFVSATESEWILATYVFPTNRLRSTDDTARLALEWGVDGTTSRLTGWDVLGVETLPVLKSEFRMISLVVLTVVIGMLIVFYRRLSLVALALTPLALTVVWLLAVMKLAGLTFNLANVFALPIVLGAGVDYGIYVMNAWKREGNITAAVAQVRKAVLLASATTIVGFGSMMLTDHSGMAQFGLLTALGILLCALNALIVLPALLTRMRAKA